MSALTDKGKQSYKDKRHSKKKESENAVKKGSHIPCRDVGKSMFGCHNQTIISFL